jgi:hypothetical protein
MRIHTGDLWSRFNEADLLLIGSHSSVVGGRFAMLGPAADKANETWKGIDVALAGKVKLNFGLLVSDKWGTIPDTWAKFGLFQTRYKPNEMPRSEVIQRATQLLIDWAEPKPDKLIVLECPVDRESSKREWQETFNILSALPHNVEVVTPIPWHNRPHWKLGEDDYKWMTMDGRSEPVWRAFMEREYGGDPDNFFFGNARRLMPGSPLFLMWPAGFVERMQNTRRKSA